MTSFFLLLSRKVLKKITISGFHKTNLMDRIYATRPISVSTKRQYDKQYNVLKNLFPSSSENADDGVSIASETNILHQIHSNYSNPNTIRAYLKLIIMIRKMNGRHSALLVREFEREKKNLEIHNEERKEELKSSLPTYNDIYNFIRQIPSHEHLKYIINHLMFYSALRNQDVCMTIVSSDGFVEEPDKNYIVLMKTRCKIIINKYKTSSSYGRKEWIDTLSLIHI
jgi:hypothetical protein